MNRPLKSSANTNHMGRLQDKLEASANANYLDGLEAKIGQILEDLTINSQQLTRNADGSVVERLSMRRRTTPRKPVRKRVTRTTSYQLTSVSFRPDQVRHLDLLVKQGTMANRSEAVRKLLDLAIQCNVYPTSI